jgi:hypothetical protein
MLGRMRFMKVNHHKKFDYRPMYYSERKEQLMKQVERYQKEDSAIGEREVDLRDQFARNKRYESYQNQSLKSTIRLIVVLAILIGAVYFIFSGMDDMTELYNSTTK